MATGTRYRRGETRERITFRLAGDATDVIDRLAEEASTDEATVSQGEQIRRMLAYAYHRMPAGWQEPANSKTKPVRFT